MFLAVVILKGFSSPRTLLSSP